MPSISPSSRERPLSLGRQTLSLPIDSALLDRLERLSGGDREGAITAALELWCQQQEQRQRQRAAQQRQAQREGDETGWLV